VIGIVLATVSLSSCKLAKNQLTYDRSAEKDIQDYRDALAPRALPPEEASSNVPDFQPVVSTPEDLQLPAPLVTVSVNQTVSLRDLMFELAEQADVDLEMDPQIRGSIIFTAKERPFNEVVDRICEMSGLRYKFENNVLRIELDRPYIKSYKVDYMSSTRSSTSKITTKINSDGGSGADSSIENKFDADFWKDLDEGLKQILTASDTYLSLATMADPVATPVAPPAPPPPDPNNPNAAVPPPAATMPPSLNVSVPPASSEPLVPNPPATYSISKDTGTVTVFASERQQKLVQKFFDHFRHVSLTQVLIEAKVLEVALTDQFATGIDWGTAYHNITGLASVNFGNTGTNNLATLSGSNRFPTFTANLDFGHGLEPIVEALSSFGTVRTLSSPRIAVLNNQPAALTVADNKVYFSIKVTVTTTTIGNQVFAVPTYTVDPKNYLEGIMMDVVPTANSDTGEVILSIRPTITKKISDVEDPSIKLNDPDSTIKNLVPELSIQTIDSTVKMQSGQTVVMGGLMKDNNTVVQTGVPILGDMPFVGTLFRSHADLVGKQELVILLHATIIPGANADQTDRDTYKKFGMDRHPSRL